MLEVTFSPNHHFYLKVNKRTGTVLPTSRVCRDQSVFKSLQHRWTFLIKFFTIYFAN